MTSPPHPNPLPKGIGDFHGKRLIWNFEIAPSSVDPTPDWLTGIHDPLKWEARYFWPESETIILYGLDDRYLNLSRYTYKHREDTYYLLKSLPLNIKKRRDRLFYKPLLSKLDGPLLEGIHGFGKKINLQTYPSDVYLPGLSTMSAPQLLAHLKFAKTIKVTKEMVSCSFPSNPVIQLELSRLTIKTHHYFSLCLQVNSADLVLKISTHLLRNQISCQYVSFLQRISMD